MLIITAICVVALIFPLFTSFYLAVKWQEKSALITITIFGLSIFRLNLALVGSKIYIKKTFKRPYCISLSPSTTFGAKMPILFKLNVLSITMLSNVGLGDDMFAPIIAVSAVETLKNAAFNVISANKQFIKIQNDVNLYENAYEFEMFLKVKTVFNAIDLIAFFIGKILEKIHYAIGK